MGCSCSHGCPCGGSCYHPIGLMGKVISGLYPRFESSSFKLGDAIACLHDIWLDGKVGYLVE